MDEMIRNSGLSRRELIGSALAALAATGARADAFDGEVAEAAVTRDFDFLFGRWRVAHRSHPASRPGEWRETTGECTTLPLLQGRANGEDHLIQAASGVFTAFGLRAFDPQARRWSIWWFDSRDPHHLDPPVVGGFEGGIGTFRGQISIDGRPVAVRFLWTRTDTPSPHWEQAYSRDDGATWETNWTMDFTRA